MILLLTFGVTGRQGHLMNYQLEKTFILKGIRPTRIPPVWASTRGVSETLIEVMASHLKSILGRITGET